MKRITIIVSSAVLLCSCNWFSNRHYVPSSQIPEDTIDVYLVGGQSNADGRVFSQYPDFVKNKKVDSVYVWERKQKEFGTYQLGPGSEYLSGSDVKNSNAFSFDIIALKQLQRKENKNIYIIKRTKGNTSVAAKTPGTTGSWHYPVSDTMSKPILLEEFKKEIQDCVEQLAAHKKTVRFKALLWHQGEGDYQPPFDAQYFENTKAIFEQIRLYSGNQNLPIILGSISHKSAQFSGVVEASQKKLAETDSNIHLIDLSNETLQDPYHFDYNAIMNFGNKVYAVLKDIK
ncbi:sialate O-acetylesterase [Pinibacter aurantiacus]|uniref:Sialate O-acetylesterase n=1 Tax=Pinibacter aurantiacus TaxID=2851599 RepID=A0A9E2W3Y7_9BACT|nr:sialate O-acetylesterase [Pinibacter aurantiacus]MBV4356808.1 sialate O-acetylesterase [Pinibacter aurantiacus]